MNPAIAVALPAVRYIGGAGLPPFPIVLADATTVTRPSAPLPVLDLSGFNTLSIFTTITNVVAGNTFKVVLAVIDPGTGAVVPSNLGDATLISATASGSFASTLYLPAYYATLTGLILPFFQAVLVISNTGGNAGNMNVTALGIWLSNA